MPTAATLTPLLAGTQCTLCGYPSCAAYAEALATGQTENPTLCVPGGPRVATAITTALYGEAIPETPTPHNPVTPPVVAFITEADCIGCTLCLQKCPTAAIVGAPKQLHTILTNLCTGCNLCIPVCPTNCISLAPAPPKHPLTEQQPDGSLTLAASQKIWSLVTATQIRHTTTQSRTVQIKAVAPAASLSTLSPEILAKIAAAQTKSHTKYAAKGPIRTPRALKPKA